MTWLHALAGLLIAAFAWLLFGTPIMRRLRARRRRRVRRRV